MFTHDSLVRQARFPPLLFFRVKGTNVRNEARERMIPLWLAMPVCFHELAEALHAIGPRDRLVPRGQLESDGVQALQSLGGELRRLPFLKFPELVSLLSYPILDLLLRLGERLRVVREVDRSPFLLVILEGREHGIPFRIFR